MMSFERRGLLSAVLAAVFLVGGCSSRKTDDPTQLTHSEPKLPPLHKPDLIETSRFLGSLPSGRLYDLSAQRIAVAALPDFRDGSDPRTYLNDVVQKEKSRGSSYLPYHFYVTPAGQVFQGQSERRCGYLEGKIIRDSFIVGVMGDYDSPTVFMPEVQQNALIQLCAWLCHQYSLDPRRITPAPNINPESPPLGQNLAIWFGPTQTLQTRVDSTLAQGVVEKKQSGITNPFYRGINKQDELSSGF